MTYRTTTEIVRDLTTQFEEPDGAQERRLLSQLKAVTIELHRTPRPVGATEELHHRQLTGREHELRTALEEAQFVRRTEAGEQRLRTIRQGSQATFVALRDLAETYRQQLLVSQKPRTKQGIKLCKQLAAALAARAYSVSKADYDKARRKVDELQARFWQAEAGDAA